MFVPSRKRQYKKTQRELKKRQREARAKRQNKPCPEGRAAYFAHIRFWIYWWTHILGLVMGWTFAIINDALEWEEHLAGGVVETDLTVIGLFLTIWTFIGAFLSVVTLAFHFDDDPYYTGGNNWSHQKRLIQQYIDERYEQKLRRKIEKGKRDPITREFVKERITTLERELKI